MSIEKKLWGNHDGKDCWLITLSNGKLTASFTNYGGAVVSLIVPDRNGEKADVVLGYDTLEGFVNGKSCQGALIGRYANRIGGAKFTLGGKEIKIAPNDNGVNHLHGGNIGFDKKVWEVKNINDGDEPNVTFSYTSPDGEENYPGTVVLDVTYTVKDSTLEIAYNAVSDKETIMNFTNHSYFNLAGAGSGNILNHTAKIYSEQYTPVDSLLIPTGEIADVKGTPFDFTAEKRIAEDIENGALPGGYDHNYVLGTSFGTRKAAEIYEPNSGRVMTVYTDMPAIQFYIGGGITEEPGKNGTKLFKNAGLCLESQFCPDTPNQPNFKPSCVYKAGEKYTSVTSYIFSVR